MKKTIIISSIIIIIILLGFITYHEDWYTYESGYTEYNYYIYGIKYKTEIKK